MTRFRFPLDPLSPVRPSNLAAGTSCTVLCALKLTRCTSTQFYDNRCLPRQRVLMEVLRAQLLAPSWYKLDATASQHNA